MKTIAHWSTYDFVYDCNEPIEEILTSFHVCDACTAIYGICTLLYLIFFEWLRTGQNNKMTL